MQLRPLRNKALIRPIITGGELRLSKGGILVENYIGDAFAKGEILDVNADESYGLAAGDIVLFVAQNAYSTKVEDIQILSVPAKDIIAVLPADE